MAGKEVINSREKEVDAQELGSNQPYTLLITVGKKTYRREERGGMTGTRLEVAGGGLLRQRLGCKVFLG